MSWKGILKSQFKNDTRQRWFIKTDEVVSTLPNELINQLGNDPTEKLARVFKNGLLVDVENNTHYTIENGKITKIAQHKNA